MENGWGNSFCLWPVPLSNPCNLILAQFYAQAFQVLIIWLGANAEFACHHLAGKTLVLLPWVAWTVEWSRLRPVLDGVYLKMFHLPFLSSPKIPYWEKLKFVFRKAKADVNLIDATLCHTVQHFLQVPFQSRTQDDVRLPKAWGGRNSFCKEPMTIFFQS